MRKDFPDSAKSVCKYLSAMYADCKYLSAMYADCKYLSAMYADCKLQSLQGTAFKPLQSAKYWKHAEKAV